MAENETVTEITCCTCGILFGLSSRLNKLRLDDGKDFYCPNGHGMKFNKSRENQLQEAKKNAEFWEKEAQRLLEECDRLRDKLGEKPEKGWKLWNEIKQSSPASGTS